jgi:acetoin utilization protein AcuB
MPVHFVGSRRPATVWVDPAPAFEGQCEFRGHVVDVGPSIPHRISYAEVQCQKGGPVRSGSDCLACHRFRGWRAGPTDDEVTLTCCWSDSDPVWARMTAAVALATVNPQTPCAVADEVARSHDVRHLLVVDEGAVIGVLCRCDLFPRPGADETVADRMSREVFAVPPGATLADAVAAMSGLGIGCLPVVAGGLLVGVLTRGDLRRAGVPEALLGARRCGACGSLHGVRSHPRLGETDFCLDCLERDESAGEPGEGD